MPIANNTSISQSTQVYNNELRPYFSQLGGFGELLVREFFLQLSVTMSDEIRTEMEMTGSNFLCTLTIFRNQIFPNFFDKFPIKISIFTILPIIKKFIDNGP